MSGYVIWIFLEKMASATSDQGLRCLPVTSFKLPVLKRVKMRLDNVEIKKM